MKKIGFIGLGIMGKGMAANLIKAGYDVKLYNRTKSKAEELAAIGGKVVHSPAEAAQDSDIIITMLSTPEIVTEIIMEEDGVIGSLKSGAVVIDCSTVDPDTSQILAQQIEEVGAFFIDAPVTGSKAGAENGELVFMVGAKDEVLATAIEVFDVMGKKTIHAGVNGCGSAVKLCFNLMVSHTAVALAESLVMGTKAGLDPKVILEVMMSGAIASKFIEWKAGCMINRDFSTNFSTKLMHKDTHLIQETGYTLGVPMPVTAAVSELLSMSKAKGFDEDDFCSVIKVLEDFAGVEVQA